MQPVFKKCECPTEKIIWNILPLKKWDLKFYYVLASLLTYLLLSVAARWQH